MKESEIVERWKHARIFFLSHFNGYPREWADDFASYVATLLLKGNVPQKFFPLALSFLKIHRSKAVGFADVHEDFEPSAMQRKVPQFDWDEMRTAQERREMLAELDRHIVGPRQEVKEWSEPAVGDNYERHVARQRRHEILEKLGIDPKPKRKYVPTGRPRGRRRRVPHHPAFAHDPRFGGTPRTNKKT